MKKGNRASTIANSYRKENKKEEPKVGIGIMYLVPASPADDRGGEVLRDTTHGISHLR